MDLTALKQLVASDDIFQNLYNIVKNYHVTNTYPVAVIQTQGNYEIFESPPFQHSCKTH